MSLTDFNICQDSISPSSKSGSNNICDCPPEYVCIYDCPEGGAYSISTLISWQHFPRSTSSRSLCDDSEEVGKQSVSSLPTIQEESESEKEKLSSTVYPITKSFSQLNALHYLEIRHVFEFFNFLIGHLVCNEPDDPLQFLVDLLDKCINYRDTFSEPPMLFTHAHVQSLYSAFDPFERGYLTMNQYHEAMKALGLENSITPYNKEPPVNEDGCVGQEYFIFEAERCLINNLRQMVRIPKTWEENRLRWKKKMEKRRKKELERKKKQLEEKTEEFEGEGNEIYCQCSNSSVKHVCQCWRDVKISNEPEQLFLD